MMEEIIFNNSEFPEDAETYDAIKTAVEVLSTISQDQFECIKKEKWYNRVFDMVTFSQKGKKRLAEQISTVAQAQQIFIEVLLRLSSNNSHIAELVSEEMNYICRIQDQNIYLLQQIQRLQNVAAGIKPDMDIKKLTDIGRKVLCSCLYMINDNNEGASDEQKRFANEVLLYIDTDVRMDNPIAFLDELDVDSKRKILACCMEYIFLKDFSSDSFIAYRNFIDEFDFGNKTISGIKEHINSLYGLRGVEGFYSKYATGTFNGIEMSFKVDFDAEDVTREDSGEESNEIMDESFEEISEEMDETVWIEAGEECARICYEDIKLDDNPYYLESEEYIVYGKGTVVYCINKNSIEKKEVLTTTGTAKEYIKSGKITALSHAVYYLVGNDLYYKNLDTLESKKISDLSQILTQGGSIQEISVRDNRDFICWINSDLVICNLEQEGQVVKRIKVVPPDGGSHPKYFVRGEYVYYLEGYLNDDNCFRYSLNKCHIESGNISTCSSLFGKNSTGGKREYYDFIIEGMFGNYYYALYNYCGEKSRDCTEGYDCFVINTETQKEQYFNISSKHLYQVEQYNNFLVYIDGDSSYSLTIHNLLNNKRKILRKNCGYNDKTTLIEKIYVGDVFLNHHPASYIRIGRWIFIEDQERYYPEIISI